MEILKLFFGCPFNQDEKFQDLDRIIQNYKKKENPKHLQQLIVELRKIIQTKNYVLVSSIIKKYGNRKFNNLKETEKLIKFLYDKFMDISTNIKPEDFKSAEDKPATIFKNKNVAQGAVKENLRHNAEKIALWLIDNNSSAFKAFEFIHDNSIGYGFLQDADISSYNLLDSKITYDLVGSKIILEKDPTQELGFKILTAFPI